MDVHLLRFFLPKQVHWAFPYAGGAVAEHQGCGRTSSLARRVYLGVCAHYIRVLRSSTLIIYAGACVKYIKREMLSLLKITLPVTHQT